MVRPRGGCRAASADFSEVQYEDMADPARRLIDHVGLEWDDACLSFHKNQRNIRTASVTQLRQPIYTSSVEHWRNYEKFLGRLLGGDWGSLTTRHALPRRLPE